MSLRKKTLQGIFWTLSQQFSVQAINFGTQILLARILIPEAFGLIAMLSIFMSIGQTLVDSGMTSSLIRTVNPDQRDYSTVFFMNLAASGIIYIVLFFLAPFVASFFSQPILTAIIRVYMLTFIIQALVSVQTTKLTKEMKFKLQMMMQIPATLIGGVVGVAMAYYGFGVWSLVGLSLTSSFVNMVQHWFRSKWRPEFIIDREKLHFHFNFGYKLTLSSLLTNIYLNSYTFLIGKFFSPAQLGYYNQANSLRMFPVTSVTAALKKVTYPMFSSIQDDNQKLKQVFKLITQQVFFVMAPLMLLLNSIAEPLIRFGLTQKWLPAVPYFQFLCISAIVYPLSMYNLNIISAKGRSDLYLKMEIIKKVSSIAFLLLIIPYGIWGVIYAQSISMLIHAYVNALYSGKMINYSIGEQLKDIYPIFTVSIFAFILNYYLDIACVLYFQSSDMSRIIIGVVNYTTVYIGMSFLLKLKPLIEFRRMIFTFNTRKIADQKATSDEPLSNH